MKNRKREICTSGTVRDEDGNVLIYSANDRGDRGNVGIIRSPVRATILPDHRTRPPWPTSKAAYEASSAVTAAELGGAGHMYGPAVRRKRVSSICRLFGLASMYPASDWSVCSGPPWISAHVRSH
jgi:hypothetical protein